jgi:formylmethanofuran dehydrogenase subunit B
MTDTPTPDEFTFDDVACTVCGCVCDDLRVTVAGGAIVRAENACRLAAPWFAEQGTVAAPCRIGGEPAAFADAVARAAAILSAAKSPLIYGLSRSTTDGQRRAVALADRLGATIDTTASTGHAASIVALQQVGESTCTLGEVKQRADLVVFWRSDPATTHPRHVERYCPPGTVNGRPRRVIVVDSALTETAKAADRFVDLPDGTDADALQRLRLMVRGLPVDATPELRDLAAELKRAKFAVVFFGTDLTRGRLGHRTVEALLELVTELNDHTRAYARRMRRYSDVAGADSVLTWQTGYPFGVNFARGYPRYNPGEFTGPEMLARADADACLVVGSETVATFPPAALAGLRAIPTVLLDAPGRAPGFLPAVSFTTAVYGVHRPGTAYRLDEVPIPLRVLLPTDAPDDAGVLAAILAALEG